LATILSLICAIQFVSGQVTGVGPCPNVQGVQNFDVKKYMGLWYEFKKYPNFFSLGSKCITATYDLKKDGTVSVFNQQVKNGAEDKILGVARLLSPGVGELGVSFPTVPCDTETCSFESNSINFHFHSQRRGKICRPGH
jgi:lipocalin